MEGQELNHLKSQLIWRKEKIQKAISGQIVPMHLVNLLKEVDSALERIDSGTFGLCVVCSDPIDPERLIVDPLTRVCLDHLSTNQQKELEEDLTVATHIQKAMLPKNNRRLKGFEVYYHYDAAGAVSGDYCDVIDPGSDSNSLYFILGDVSGKGIAASMLMTHLRAMFQSLVPLGIGIANLMSRASRLLCESTTSYHFATLLCVKANKDGKTEICNAGHCPPLLIGSDRISRLDSNGMPIGIFCESEYTMTNFNLKSGEMILLYSDGLTEAMKGDNLYGMERLEEFSAVNRNLPPAEFVKRLVSELYGFLDGDPRKDDLTIMAIKKL